MCKTPPPIQAANTEINQHLDGLKKQLEKSEISQTEYDSQVANWQRGQVLLNSIATELSAPTQSAAGIAAAGAINAGGAEAAMPVISTWLYGEIDGSALTEEQKETVSAIINLLGAAMGAAIDNSSTNATQGSLNAQCRGE